MRIISLNVRGLGSKAKRTEVRNLIRSYNVDFCMIQETKKECMDQSYCFRLWGGREIDWYARDSIGRSGGILSLWNMNNLVTISKWNLDGAVVVSGLWGSERIECCLINVYAPCTIRGKGILWEKLIQVVRQNSSCVYVAGDFNAVRTSQERAGKSEIGQRRIEADFNLFIAEAGLLDLQLQGRAFTWYKRDGSCKSRLDRFLVNSAWLNLWPDLIQKGLPRSISDHVPILLMDLKRNWGPKPFKFVNAWIHHPNFSEEIGKKWADIHIEGWAGFVIKEKLKAMRSECKSWSEIHFNTRKTSIENRKQNILRLDMLDDALGLSEDEIIERSKENSMLLRDLGQLEKVSVGRSCP